MDTGLRGFDSCYPLAGVDGERSDGRGHHRLADPSARPGHHQRGHTVSVVNSTPRTLVSAWQVGTVEFDRCAEVSQCAAAAVTTPPLTTPR
jgi:hypothetical protein